MAFRDCIGFHRSRIFVLAISYLSILISGCGGSGGGSPVTPPPPAGDFTIAVTPSSLNLKAGDSQTLAVSVAAVNGFASSITISTSGLPAGVAASPATFSLTPGSQQQVVVTVGTTAQNGAATVTFQGTSGGLSHSAQTSLSIVVPVTGAHAPIRNRFLRTNAYYDPQTMNDAPPHFSVYDSAHHQFFVSNPYLNEIDVFDATKEIETAEIPVPTAWGLDISPYNGSLYAGTLIGDVYQINTSTLSVINRYLAASIGPNGFVATTALALSDGRLALQGAQLGIPGVDGFGTPAVWNPVSNSLDYGSNGEGVCPSSNGAFALSGDRTRILASTVDEGGGGEGVCSYDPIAKVATYGTFPYATFVRQIIPTPDGTRFFLTSNLYGVGVFDAKTVQMLGQITGGSGSPEPPSGTSGALMSLDGKTLYLITQDSEKIGAFDTTSFAQTGWIPSFATYDYQSGVAIGAIDGTGLMIGPIGHGVGFIDSTRLTTTMPTMLYGIAPTLTGPLAGGTAVNFLFSADITDSATLSDVYVGNVSGAGASIAPEPVNKITAQVTTPPSNQAGAVDLAVVLNDGGIGIAPEGFSYGPTILEVVPNGATADGGQVGTIIGYGFGSTTSGVQVAISGRTALVGGIYSVTDLFPAGVYPFPASVVQFMIPPGTAGTVEDVTVTTPSGSTTASGAFRYTAAVQSFPLNANLQAGIYDSGRKLYYFAAQAQIEVLSASTGHWLAPISLPGVTSKTQLLAISESPSGSLLAVSDYGDQAIYLLNPDSPMSAEKFSVNGQPEGLAVTDARMVYFEAYSGCGFCKLDTSTGSITQPDYLQAGMKGYIQGGSVADEYDRVLLSPDGSRVYSSNEGRNFWTDTSDDQIQFAFNASSLGGEFPDVAVSGDGSTVDMASNLTDPSLNVETEPTYIDWETWIPLAVGGQKLNQDGSILFQPLTDGVDLVARNTGRLLYRIQIPVAPASVYDPLVVGPGINTLAVISATGVSIVDLSSLPVAAQYTQPFVSARDAAVGDLRSERNAEFLRQINPESPVRSGNAPRLRHISNLGLSGVPARTP